MTLSTWQPDTSGSAAEIDETREVMRVVADLVSLVEPRLLALWKATGMTFGQRRVLRQLRNGPRAAGSIATSLGVAAPTLTRQLVKLEERGLITRVSDRADRRRVMVTLTASGRRSLTDHRVFKGGPIALAARELTSRERRELALSGARLTALARKQLGAGGSLD
jgi:DNA-binding MarR family transcriptional regulator